MVIARLAVLIFLLGPLSVLGQTLTLESLQELEKNMHAAPREVGRQLEQYLGAQSLDDDPRLWLKALSVHMLLFQGDLDAPESMALQKKWMDAAQESLPRIPDSREKLEYEMAYWHVQVRTRGLTDKAGGLDAHYDEMIQRSRAIKLKTVTSKLLGDYAELALNEQRFEKALQLANEALEELKGADFPEWSLARPSVKSIVALVFLEAGREAESLQLYQEILREACEGKDNPYFCNPILTNIAFIHVNSQDPKIYRKALPYLDRAIKDAERIQDTWTIAVARHKKAHILLREGHYEETIQLETAAFDLFVRLKDMERAVNALVFKARALNKLGRFKEAMQVLDEGENMLKSANKPTFNNLIDARIDAFLGLKRFEEAFKLLNKIHVDMEKELSARSQQSFSEAAARVGLQLEQEKNKVLERDQKIHELRMKESQRLQQFLIMGLGLSAFVILASLWAVLRSREVRLIKNKLQNILDSIDEAILILGSDLRIRGPVSPFLQHIRQDDKDPVGQDFIESVLAGSLLSEDECATIRQSLFAMFGEDRLAFELNVAHLPLELVFARSDQHRIHAIHWQPIFDHHQHLRSMIISMRDITDRKVLEESMRREKREHERAARCLLELSRTNFGRVKILLEQLEKLLDLETAMISTVERLRSAHTCKGVARGLGLSVLSASIHRFEDALQKNTIDREPLQDTIKVYQDLLNQLDSSQMTAKANPLDLAGVWNTIQPSIKERLKEEGFQLGGVQLKDEIQAWTNDSIRVLEQCLMHAVNNTIDHGFLFPRRRGAHLEAPYFEVSATHEDGKALIIIRDNGAGLDMERLQIKAKELNWKSGSDLTELLFQDGVSTAQTLSETSGRGVGLAAIRELCRQQGGEARLQPRFDRSGTELHLTLSLVTLPTLPSLSIA